MRLPQGRWKYIILTAIVILVSSLPQRAGLQEGRDLDAEIYGPSKFAAGKTGTLHLTIQNNIVAGSIDSTALQLGLGHYFGAAVGVTAVLKSSDSPVTVETERLLLGTIPSGETVSPIPFTLTVADDAEGGFFSLELELAYRVLEEVRVGQKIDFEWLEKTETLELTVEVLEEPLKFGASDINTVLRVGMKDQLSLTFTNEGRETADKAQVKISAVSPLSMTDDTAYLGTLEPGGSAVGIFGLRIAGDAIPKEYLIQAQVKYFDGDGQEALSEPFRIPVEVLPRGPVVGEGLQSPLAGGLLGFASAGLIFFLWMRISAPRKRKPMSSE